MPGQYDHKRIEQKWNQRWEEEKTHRPDLRRAKRPFYNLMMFPYPSAEGLHVGNVFAFVGSDIQGRLKRAQGYQVFEPMGFDAFGIHSENHALKLGIHPRRMIPRNIERFREGQLKRIGNMFDWSHQVNTTDPSYYRWTQWIFLKLFQAGLAFRRSGEVNWCPSCKTVLADEQAEGGCCERCQAAVQPRRMKQWFFRITAYAPQLLENLAWIDWSEVTKNAQRNWIGRSKGTEILFEVAGSAARLKVFTTRPDTLWGATFLALAPEHPRVRELTQAPRRAEMDRYLERCSAGTPLQRREASPPKSGLFTGTYGINPATGKRIPLWVADYVLLSHGSGAIMGVPAHDQRDFEFARTFKLPLVQVVRPPGKAGSGERLKEAYPDDGILVNSGPFSGRPSREAREQIGRWLSERGTGGFKHAYRLRDWCISRQRYWGPPIPIIYCRHCGTLPVPEKDLPVVLPLVENFRPDGSGKSPLARDPHFLNTPCPRCSAPAQRETDVSDNFLDSAWYFLRYPSSGCHDRIFDKKLSRKWLPVDMYVGGNEHAVLHLMYTRFITMALHDMGLIDFAEPFKKFRAHGLIIKDGFKMSKSRGNAINPDAYLEKYGADVFRTYLMSFGNFQKGGDFRDKNIVGTQRFLDRLWRYAGETDFSDDPVTDPRIRSLLNRKIKKVTRDIERLHYNTAVAAIGELFQGFVDQGVCQRDAMVILLKLLAPFAPFITHELWERLGGSGILCEQPWPQYDESYLGDEKVEFVLQVNGRIRDRLRLPAHTGREALEGMALKRERIRRYLGKERIARIVFVPRKLLNIVTTSAGG